MLATRLGLPVAVLLIMTAPVLGAAGEPDLDGMYISEGLNGDGTSYRGVVHLARQGDSFVVTWMVPHATDERVVLVRTALGIGIVDAGVLAVSYYTTGMIGVVLYRIEEDGRRLTGRWAVAGTDGGAYSETLTKLPKDTGGAQTPASPEVPKPRPPAGASRRTVPEA